MVSFQGMIKQREKQGRNHFKRQKAWTFASFCHFLRLTRCAIFSHSRENEQNKQRRRAGKFFLSITTRGSDLNQQSHTIPVVEQEITTTHTRRRRSTIVLQKCGRAIPPVRQPPTAPFEIYVTFLLGNLGNLCRRRYKSNFFFSRPKDVETFKNRH